MNAKKTLTSDNFEFSLDENIVQLQVTGPMDRDAFREGLDWFEAVQADPDISANDNLSLCVEMQSDNFSDLSEARAEFRKVGDVLRRAQEIDRCAVVTDNAFIRNTAKIEGAVIPGLDIMSFSPDEAEAAESWLRDEPLAEAPAENQPVAQTAVVTPQSPQKSVAVPPAPPAQDTANPWDNFSVKNLNL